MIHWQDPLEVAAGDAHRGPWRMNRSDFRYVDDPAVALTPEGAAGVAWVDQARRAVLFQLYAPGGEARFPEPVNVSGSPDTFSWLPRVRFAPGGAGVVYLLWEEIVFTGGAHGGEIHFARSLDGGRTFSPPLSISGPASGAGKGRLTAEGWDNGSYDLAIGRGGELYAAWTDFDGVLSVSRSTDGGATFSPPRRIAGGGDEPPVRGPSLAAAGDGTVYLAWSVGEDPAGDVRLARSRDRGASFDAPRTVAPVAAYCDAPRVAVDARGTVHLVFGGGPFGHLRHYRIGYTRSTDGGEGFEVPREVSAPAAGEGAAYPDLCLDPDGTLYVLWERFLPGEGRPRGLGITLSRDGGDTFAPPALVPGSDDPRFGSNGGWQGLFMRRLAAGGAGEVAVVLSTCRPGVESRIRLFRGRVEG